MRVCKKLLDETHDMTVCSICQCSCAPDFTIKMFANSLNNRESKLLIILFDIRSQLTKRTESPLATQSLEELHIFQDNKPADDLSHSRCLMSKVLAK